MNPLPVTQKQLEQITQQVSNAGISTMDTLERYLPGIGVPAKSALNLPLKHSASFYQRHRGTEVSVGGLIFLTSIYVPKKLYQGSSWSIKEKIAAGCGVAQAFTFGYLGLTSFSYVQEHLPAVPETKLSMQMQAREEDANISEYTYLYEDMVNR